MKADLSNVKSIIFDLGKVLLNLDFDASIKAFRQLGLDSNVLDRQQAYADPVFYQLEIGMVSAEEFRKRVRQVLKNPLATDRQIEDAWCAMILDVPKKRVEKLLELHKKYRIFLFSNTNIIHINYLLPRFKEEHGIDFPSMFEKDFYSFELQERKPDLGSFVKVIDLAGVVPQETLFVDDLEKNIESAAKSGLQTLWLKEGMEMADLF